MNSETGLFRRGAAMCVSWNGPSRPCRPGAPIFVRGDSALYEQEVLAWREKPARGIGYTSSADMSPQRRTEIGRLPETAWQPESADHDALRQ